jgi:hypothetical protein
MWRALLLLVAGLALLAGCGGGDHADDEGTIQQLKITYTAGPRTVTADTWTLEGGVDAASRSRLQDGGEVSSDVALSDGFVSLWTPETGSVVESPAQSGFSPDPLAVADEMVDAGALIASGTEQRDGREIQVYRGPAAAFLLAGAEGTIGPADAVVRYLRDDTTGRPVELRIPAARVLPKGGPAARLPVQRYVVTGFREYPATEEAMEVFDLKAVYDAAGTATTTAP